MNHTVLLVDDEPRVLEGLKRVLHKEPYRLLAAHSAESAAHVVESEAVDLIVTDEQMPGMSGTQFLARVRERFPDIVGIVLTGHPTVESALTAINQGNVHQFFTKPCNEIDLALAIRRALEQKELTQKSRELLEVSRRQSALLDETRILRRMKGVQPAERAAVVANEAPPQNRRRLLDDIDEELKRSRALLDGMSAFRDAPDDPSAHSTDSSAESELGSAADSVRVGAARTYGRRVDGGDVHGARP